MRWKIPAALDIIFSTLAAVTACALGNVLVAIHFPATLPPHSNVIARFMFRSLIAPKSLAEALIPPYWLPPVWWPLLIGLLGLAVAEFILILLSSSFVDRVAVLGIAKSQGLDISSAYRQVQAVPDFTRRIRLFTARRIMLVTLPRKMTALFILGVIAGGIAWLISLFADHFSNGILQVFLACALIAIGWFIFDVIDEAKKEIMGSDEALDLFSEIADAPDNLGVVTQNVGVPVPVPEPAWQPRLGPEGQAERERAAVRERSARDQAEWKRTGSRRVQSPQAFYRRPLVWVLAVLVTLAGIGVATVILVTSGSTPSSTPKIIGAATTVQIKRHCGTGLLGVDLVPCTAPYDLRIIHSRHTASLQAGQYGDGLVAPLAPGTPATFRACASAILSMQHNGTGSARIKLTKIHPGEIICVLPNHHICTGPNGYGNCQNILTLLRIKGVSVKSAKVTLDFTTWLWGNGPS